MGANETISPSKSDKSSSVIPEQPSVRSYPDWGSMQAYYGPGIPFPTSYFGSPVAPGHAPYPYMWGPQPMITPFAGPYTAIYPHGGVYSHPSATHMSSPANQEVCVNSSTNKERSTAKKLKGFDVLVASTGNHEASAGCNENRSESDDNDAEGSSDGSDGNSESGGSEKQRNRSSEDIPKSGGKNLDRQANTVNGATTDVLPTISLRMTTPGTVTPIPLANLTPGMDIRSSSFSKQKPGSELILSTIVMDERAMKREKRKQSNRESARRSRLRKQAETEELAIKVGNLSAENTTLRSEISRLIESSDKLRIENSALMEKLKMAELKQEQELPSDRTYNKEAPPSMVIENLLSSIDNSNKIEDEPLENSNGKLHQLLDSNPRTDALAAS